MLAQLLEDPYAAVRCVAERLLKQAGGLIPPGHDFTLTPASQPGVRDTIWVTWHERLKAANPPPLPAATLVQADEPAETARRFSRLLQSRDETPVRLRE